MLAIGQGHGGLARSVLDIDLRQEVAVAVLAPLGVGEILRMSRVAAGVDEHGAELALSLDPTRGEAFATFKIIAQLGEELRQGARAEIEAGGFDGQPADAVDPVLAMHPGLYFGDEEGGEGEEDLRVDVAEGRLQAAEEGLG